MKRFLATMAGVLVVGLTFAQAPFTIVRPADGSKVRENVHILFPKNSIPDGGYLGIFVNGKFIEATLPRTGAKFLDYTLDTKTLDLPDGPTNIEAVLYVDFQEKPRIVDRSSIQVTLANKANIPEPQNGYRLRYHWAPGREWAYKWETNVTVSTLTEAQALLNGRAAELPVETHSAQVIYAMDNVYSNGDALLRMEIAPPRGKSSAVLALLNAPEPRRVFQFQMYPAYMRVRSTGQEVFGMIPEMFSFEGLQGGYTNDKILGDFPLPTLPARPVRPGDTWQTRFQLGTRDINSVNTKDSLTTKLPARAEFQGIEWEMGYPCAKIHHSFSVGSGAPGQGADGIRDNAESIDETFWFALDKGVIVKMIRTQVIDRKESAASPGPIANNNNGDTERGSFNTQAARAANRGRGGGGGGRFGGGGGGNAGDFQVPFNFNQLPGQLPGSSAPPSGPQFPGGGQSSLPSGPRGSQFGNPGGQFGDPNQSPGGQPIQAPAPNQLVRITFSEIYTLQK